MGAALAAEEDSVCGGEAMCAGVEATEVFGAKGAGADGGAVLE